MSVLPAIFQALEKAIKEREAVELEREKSDKTKQGRVRMKVAKAEDQEAQKKWLKRQAIEHSYGQEDDADDVKPGPSDSDETPTAVVSGKSCRCGSKEHSRTSHRSCPLKKKR